MNELHLREVLPPFSPPHRYQDVACRAYEKWVKRGRPQGTALQDWLEAEGEVASEGNGKKKEGDDQWPHLGKP